MDFFLAIYSIPLSSLSFLLIPIWPGAQQNIISFLVLLASVIVYGVSPTFGSLNFLDDDA